MGDRDVLADTIYGEARGESREGKIAVAWVIRTRASFNKSYWGGSTISGVCKQPRQFECWDNQVDATGNMIITEPRRRAECLDIATGVLDGRYPDPTRGHCTVKSRGADHFYAPGKISAPGWINNCYFVCSIGGHAFYQSKTL